MQQKFLRRIDELDRIVAMTEAMFDRFQLDNGMRPVVDLAIEELFTNMVKYNTETSAQIEIEMQVHEEGVEVSLTDFDVERFDPSAAARVDVNAPLEERTPGGLGIYLVMKMVDSIQYQYRDRSSKITFIVGRK
jgi:anti-sigma regulatory factor (Ser/Thr protein kinase)